MLVSDALPTFSAELHELLLRAGEPALAGQITSLRILDGCRCGDGFCSSFYTQPKPQGAYGPGHRTLMLEPDKGTILVDVLNEEITFVEVLDRDDIRFELTGKLPGLFDPR